MKKSISYLAILLGVFLLSHSCEQKEISYEAVATEELNEADYSDSISIAATQNLADRKFIRTSDIKMEVKDVYKTTVNIESKVAKLGGFVTKSHLYSNVTSNTSYPINKDSAVNEKKYFIENEINVRVPQQYLGEFLHSLGEHIVFLDYRNIEAKDVNSQLELNSLEKLRLKENKNKLDSLAKEKARSKDKAAINDDLNETKRLANIQYIENKNLEDDVNFSTVSLLLYEKEKILKTVEANLEENNTYPNFGYKAWNALKEGFYLAQVSFVFLLEIWPFVILSIVVFYLIRYRRKRKQK